jgi:hypothetical protein
VKFRISRKVQKRIAISILALEAIIFVVAMNLLTQYVTINDKKDNTYTDTAIVDEISCDSGRISVNNVSTSVPINNNVDYNISYAWAETDTEHPSIPRAVTASYYADEEKTQPLFEITLFRESFTPKSEIPKDKDTSNWFDSWKTSDDVHGHSNFETQNDIKGYYITTINTPSEQDPNPSSYKSTDYYFAAKLKDGIAVYVLEGILYDKDRQKDYEEVYSKALSSLKINQQASIKPADGEADSEEAPDKTAV